MLPGPLAPLDPHKTRELTSIYAPRKLSTRNHLKNKTTQTRMLDDIHIKPTLSPFHPLPAIGQKLERSKTKVIVFDLNENESLDRSVQFQDVLQPLTPLRIHGFERKSSLDQLDAKKPQLLLRENTYDVIEPIYVNAAANAKVKKRDATITRKVISDNSEMVPNEPKASPKSRFKKAAMQVARLSSMPETGKLLCLREKHTQNCVIRETDKSWCKLEELPRSPAQRLDQLSEIFQNLDTKGRHRDKMKKQNSWF